MATWDQVFQIRRRYEEKVRAHFRDRIEHFAVWCERKVGLIATPQEVVAALARYIDAVVQLAHGEGTHLKRAMFEMMRQRCQEEDVSERLITWFSGMVRGQRRFLQEAA